MTKYKDHVLTANGFTRMGHYEDHRSRQMQGIARAKTEGKYKGRREGTEKRKIIVSLLKADHSYSEIQEMAKCSRQLIAEMSRELKSASGQ